MFLYAKNVNLLISHSLPLSYGFHWLNFLNGSSAKCQSIMLYVFFSNVISSPPVLVSTNDDDSSLDWSTNSFVHPRAKALFSCLNTARFLPLVTSSLRRLRQTWQKIKISDWMHQRRGYRGWTHYSTDTSFCIMIVCKWFQKENDSWSVISDKIPRMDTLFNGCFVLYHDCL